MIFGLVHCVDMHENLIMSTGNVPIDFSLSIVLPDRLKRRPSSLLFPFNRFTMPFPSNSQYLLLRLKEMCMRISE